MSQLSVELWHQIAVFLPKAGLRALLRTSRLHRSISLRLLYNLTEIFLASPSIGPERYHREEAAKGILQHISRHEEFAHAVVHLRIHAGEGGLPKKAGWQRMIIKALTFLPHLRSFEWICTPDSYNDLSMKVVAALIKSCPDLETFTNISGSHNPICLNGIENLRGLRKLALTFTPGGGLTFAPAFQGLLSSNQTTLRSLSVDGQFHDALGTFSFEHLTHLEILVGFRESLLVPIFLSGDNLRSLALSSGDGDFPAPAFEKHKHALPSLESLRLLRGGCAKYNNLGVALAKFLERHLSLKRFHLRDISQMARPPYWKPVENVLPKMKCMTALGLHFLIPLEGESWDSLDETAMALPRSLRGVRVHGSNAMQFFREPTIRLLPPLQFAHICELSFLEHSPDKARLIAMEIFRDLPSLIIVGSCLWDTLFHVVYDKTRDVVLDAQQVPCVKGDEDFEWLAMDI